eukprot:351413-Chlamydomonas_euryale.AAC.3
MMKQEDRLSSPLHASFSTPRTLHAGLFYLRANARTLELMTRLEDRLSKQKYWDQTAYNEEIFFMSHGKYKSPQASVNVRGRVKRRVLGPDLLQRGDLLDEPQETWRKVWKTCRAVSNATRLRSPNYSLERRDRSENGLGSPCTVSGCCESGLGSPCTVSGCCESVQRLTLQSEPGLGQSRSSLRFLSDCRWKARLC